MTGFKGFHVVGVERFGPVTRHPFGRLYPGKILDDSNPLRPGHSGLHFFPVYIGYAIQYNEIWEVETCGPVAGENGLRCTNRLKLIRNLGVCPVEGDYEKREWCRQAGIPTNNIEELKQEA